MIVYVNDYDGIQGDGRVIDRVAREFGRGSPEFTEASVDRHTKRVGSPSLLHPAPICSHTCPAIHPSQCIRPLIRPLIRPNEEVGGYL
jgi:hypothetical protein